MRLLPLSATLLFSLGGPASVLAQEAAPGPVAPPAPAAPAPPKVEAEAPAVALAAPAATGPTAEAEIAELKQRLDDLETQQAEASASAEEDDQRFKIYGFLDFGLKKSFPSKDPFFAALIERKLTFVLGNINLYFDAQPTAGWRALIEARLTTYPHGAETVDASGQFNRTDNDVFDT